jgi:hypothetical protein
MPETWALESSQILAPFFAPEGATFPQIVSCPVEKHLRRRTGFISCLDMVLRLIKYSGGVVFGRRTAFSHLGFVA